MNDLTRKVSRHEELTAADVARAVAELLDELVAGDDKAEFLTAFAHKGETPAEIAAFALEIRARGVDPQIDPAAFGGVLLDIVGTGADLMHTFNISSCTMFVAAAAGVAVAKHGNRAVTSRCGSADVLGALGANIELPPAAAKKCLAACGVAFFFAPLYHPAFKIIAPVRRRLAERKQRTVFNILGPLVNPARPTHQVVGVFERALVPRYAEVMRLMGVHRAFVVHGEGLDEFTTLGVNTVAELRAGQISSADFSSEPSTATIADLAGDDPPTNAEIARAVLGGEEHGPRRDIVLLNAAAALVIAGQARDFASGRQRAAELIDSGAALERLDRFIAATH